MACKNLKDGKAVPTRRESTRAGLTDTRTPSDARLDGEKRERKSAVSKRERARVFAGRGAMCRATVGKPIASLQLAADSNPGIVFALCTILIFSSTPNLKP